MMTDAITSHGRLSGADTRFLWTPPLGNLGLVTSVTCVGGLPHLRATKMDLKTCHRSYYMRGGLNEEVLVRLVAVRFVCVW